MPLQFRDYSAVECPGLESDYLTQLAEDLSSTEDNLQRAIDLDREGIARMDSLSLLFETTSSASDGQVFSLLEGLILELPRPLTGTGRALLETGDLHLLSSDSLRAAIVKYVDTSRSYEDDRRALFFGWVVPAFTDLRNVTGHDARGSHPHAVPPSTKLSDPEFYGAARRFSRALVNLLFIDERMMASVREIRAATLLADS